MATCPRCNDRTLRWWAAYNATARPRLVNPDGGDHTCPPLPIPDLIECHCGARVLRYPDGRKIGGRGALHECHRSAAIPTPPAQLLPTANPPPTRRHPMSVEATHVRTNDF